jgi:hypothetical protein
MIKLFQCHISDLRGQNPYRKLSCMQEAKQKDLLNSVIITQVQLLAYRYKGVCYK